MWDLNDEIIEEILARLPAKSLVRFNLVCKQWRYLISDPNFVRKHLNHVLVDESNNHHKLIVHSSPHFYSIDYHCEESLDSSTSTKRDFPLQSTNGLYFLGSCNGLLLLGFYDKTYLYNALVLWNPSFTDYNLLPESSFISTSGSVRLLGFGYDSSTKDYKVVRVITNSRYGKPMRDVEQKVEIYTLKTNSWKTIQGGIPYGNVSIEAVQGTLVDGSIYWIVTDADFVDKEEFDNLILAFDLIDEKFRSMGVPRYDDGESVWGSLVEVRGCLGLYQTLYQSPDVMIWILMEDENRNKCWTKLMKIPKDFGMYSRPAFFMKNDEVLLSIMSDECRKENKKLVVYNPRNMTFHNLPACGISDWWEETIYVETLVSPNGIGG
ncbi:hypothetical protein LguiB_025717 [Lonicera macranthoides]